MALGGIMHRVTPDHYNLYDEREELVGSLTHIRAREGRADVSGFPKVSYWYGLHSSGNVTGTHPSRHEAARDLLEHHQHIRHDLGLEP